MALHPDAPYLHDEDLCPSECGHMAGRTPHNEDCDCRRCAHEAVVVGLPRDFASRAWKGVTKAGKSNSYEKGIPTSERPDGSRMPYLDRNGGVMGQVEFNQNRRLIEENKRRLHNAPASTP